MIKLKSDKNQTKWITEDLIEKKIPEQVAIHIYGKVNFQHGKKVLSKTQLHQEKHFRNRFVKKDP